MEFALIVFGGLGAIVVGVLLAARYSSKSGAEILDWKPTRSFEHEVELELDDVDQMLAARNERRRRRGEAEISEEEFRGEVHAEEQAQRERARRYRSDAEGEAP